MASPTVDCISKGYKDLLATLMSRDVGKNILMEVLQSLPLCEPMPTTLSQAGLKEIEARRQKSPEWNIHVDYTDQNGKVSTFPSPSALTKALGLKMSGLQTLCDGEKCKAMDVVDIFRLHGYVVECEVEKDGKVETTLDCAKAIAGGKAMHVYHPDLFEVTKPAKTTKPAK